MNEKVIEEIQLLKERMNNLEDNIAYELLLERVILLEEKIDTLLGED